MGSVTQTGDIGPYDLIYGLPALSISHLSFLESVYLEKVIFVLCFLHM